MLVKMSNSRSRPLPMQVSIITRSLPERSTKHWNEIFIRPSGVMKCGCSQSYCSACSAVMPSDSMLNGSVWSLTSTMRAISTSPILHVLICSAAMFSPLSVQQMKRRRRRSS